MTINCGITPENISSLKSNEIFVFGSNKSGIHGGGAAYLAHKNFDAVWGIAEGITGDCYALPTKDENIKTLTIPHIKCCVDRLEVIVRETLDKHFLITKIGCGLAGYAEKDIAPLFDAFIQYSNCSLPKEFIEIITRQ